MHRIEEIGRSSRIKLSDAGELIKRENFAFFVEFLSEIVFLK